MVGNWFHFLLPNLWDNRLLFYDNPPQINKDLWGDCFLLG